MKVHIYPADEGGCGMYRLIWPAKAVQDAGYDVNVFLPNSNGANVNTILRNDDWGVPHVMDAEIAECDVAVFQRPLRRLMATAIPFLQAKGVKVVVEVDDDFHSVHPRNAAWGHSMGKTSENELHRHNLMLACAVADRVTVSTPALMSRYANNHGVLLPNYVPKAYLDIPKIFSVPNIVGWSGALESHPNDLQQMGSAFPDVVRKTGSNIRIVGDGNRIARVTGLGPSASIAMSGWVPIDQYPFRMSDIDVGVVPLELSIFNQAKSWLKGLEFASLGVPFVASPTAQYVQLSNDYGIGVIEGDRRRWGKTLCSVVARREELGASFRDRVRSHQLTIEDHALDWAKAWTEW